MNHLNTPLTAAVLREQGYPEEVIPQLLQEDSIYRQLRVLGHAIAEIAEPVKHQGGDHDYDGAMITVWRALHEVLGVDDSRCALFPTTDPCNLSRASVQPKSRRRKNFTATKRKRIMERDAYRCVTCGSHQDLALDHIIPWSKGGSDDDDNLQTMCTPCNSRKGAKL